MDIAPGTTPPPVPTETVSAQAPNVDGTPIPSAQTRPITEVSSPTIYAPGVYPSSTDVLLASDTPTAARTSSLTTSISSSSLPSATGTAQSTAQPAGGGGLSYGAKLAAIIAPTLVVLALIPIIYICYIHKRYKKGRRESTMPEVRQQPPETTLLHAHHPSHDSVSLPTPFTDTERANEPSTGLAWDHHQEETSRAPSPVLPSPSRHTFQAPEQWPLKGPLPEPPPPPPKDIEDDDSLRRPSSSYGSRQAMLPRPPSEHEEVVSPQQRSFDHDPAIRNRQSDAVSELSYDSRSRRHRTKSMDGESFISAMDEEPVHDPMPARHIV